jgi:hypothetical protein
MAADLIRRQIFFKQLVKLLLAVGACLRRRIIAWIVSVFRGETRQNGDQCDDNQGCNERVFDCCRTSCILVMPLEVR